VAIGGRPWTLGARKTSGAANAAIHPGALEIRGNRVDENCDSRAEPFGLLRALVVTNWQYGTATRVRTLVVRNAPKGADVSVACAGRGCPFHTARRAHVARDLAPVSFQRMFARARLRAGARVTVAIRAAGLVGRTYTYRMKAGDLPGQSIACRAPGAAKAKPC
jgi:hypothetical protein